MTEAEDFLDWPLKGRAVSCLPKRAQLKIAAKSIQNLVVGAIIDTVTLRKPASESLVDLKRQVSFYVNSIF